MADVAANHGCIAGIRDWPDKTKGLSFAVAGTLVSSCFGLMVRVVQHFGGFGVLALRGTFQLVALAIIVIISWGPRLFLHRLRGLDRVSYLAVGALACTATGITMGMIMTTVSNTYFIINTAPAFCVLGDFLLRIEIPIRTLVMVVLCLAGVGLILYGTYDEGGSLVGCFVALLTPIGWAIYWGIQRWRKQEAVKVIEGEVWLVIVLATLLLTVFSYAVGMVTGDLISAIEESRNKGLLAFDVAWFAFFGCFQLTVQLLFTLAPRYIPSSEVGCIKLSEAILGPIWIWLVAGERPTMLSLVGGGIILATVFVHSILALRSLRGKGNGGGSTQSEDCKPCGDGPSKCKSNVVQATCLASNRSFESGEVESDIASQPVGVPPARGFSPLLPDIVICRACI